jgi:ABC-type Na+ efflux pump permease subunit
MILLAALGGGVMGLWRGALPPRKRRLLLVPWSAFVAARVAGAGDAMSVRPVAVRLAGPVLLAAVLAAITVLGFR